MSTSSKVAIAVDIIDWPKIQYFVDNIHEAHEVYDKSTPDCTYRCVFWDDVCWCSSAAHALKKELDHFRHALIEITEEGQIYKDIVETDDRGEDGEFSEILSYRAEVCFWDEDSPITPVYPYSPGFGKCIPITRDRALRLLMDYIQADQVAGGSGYVYDALAAVGASHAEIRALGFGDCIPEEEESE